MKVYMLIEQHLMWNAIMDKFEKKNELFEDFV